MEPALEADDRRPLRVAARELDGVLDGLGAGVEERRLAGPENGASAIRRSAYST